MPNSKATKIIAMIARILLGLMFLVFGLNGFFHFMPMPPMPEAVNKWMAGVSTGGYFFPLLAATQIFVGVCLLTGFFVPLALVVLLPLTINIFLFHAFVEGPSTLGMPVGILILQIYLAWVYREYYRKLLTPRALL